ncbi:MAG: hypothetical protein K2W92_07075 [Alphaproteobacteria bacterium]|nr:hypothetical protein [Alphaproteobacteria bacterium]
MKTIWKKTGRTLFLCFMVGFVFNPPSQAVYLIVEDEVKEEKPSRTQRAFHPYKVKTPQNSSILSRSIEVSYEKEKPVCTNSNMKITSVTCNKLSAEINSRLLPCNCRITFTNITTDADFSYAISAFIKSGLTAKHVSLCVHSTADDHIKKGVDKISKMLSQIPEKLPQRDYIIAIIYALFTKK